MNMFYFILKRLLKLTNCLKNGFFNEKFMFNMSVQIMIVYLSSLNGIGHLKLNFKYT